MHSFSKDERYYLCLKKRSTQTDAAVWKMDAIGVRCSRGCHWHMQTGRIYHCLYFPPECVVNPYESFTSSNVNLWTPLKKTAFLCERYQIYNSNNSFLVFKCFQLCFCVSQVLPPISTPLPRKARASPLEVLDKKVGCESWASGIRKVSKLQTWRNPLKIIIWISFI